MDKQHWLELTKEQRSSQLKNLLTALVELQKAGVAVANLTAAKKQRKDLEEQVYDIIAWEKEEHEE